MLWYNVTNTDPSGRSLSKRRLQSTTGPPVPMRSLDCRLTTGGEETQDASQLLALYHAVTLLSLQAWGNIQIGKILCNVLLSLKTCACRWTEDMYGCLCVGVGVGRGVGRGCPAYRLSALSQSRCRLGRVCWGPVSDLCGKNHMIIVNVLFSPSSLQPST